MRTMKHWALAVMTAAALALAGCGGGGSTATAPPPPTSTPYETAVAAIAAAETPEAAQAAYDAVKDDVTAAQGEMLQDAVDARQTVLATMARANEQRLALMTAVGMVDTSDLSTQDLVNAARTAIAGLRQAIADAADVDDTSMYQSMLDEAVGAVDTAQGGIDTATRRTNQMTALSDASGDLQDALAALSGVTPTQALLDDANNALTALNDAITAGADLTDTEKAPYQHEAGNAAAPISMAQNAFDDAEDEADKTAAAVMAVTAMRLYAGIGDDPLGGGRAADSDGDGVISVTTATGETEQALSRDKDAMVADHHGWAGAMHTAEPDGEMGTYEAVVYSNVGEPTEGAEFNDSANGGYTLDSDDQIADVTSVSEYEGLVDSPSFDQSAGTKMFELPDNTVRLTFAGTFTGYPARTVALPPTPKPTVRLP